jgi:hypothetical protein
MREDEVQGEVDFVLANPEPPLGGVGGLPGPGPPMHEKQNLGVETITIPRTGMVTLGQRQVLAKRVSDRVPDIRY